MSYSISNNERIMYVGCVWRGPKNNIFWDILFYFTFKLGRLTIMLKIPPIVYLGYL